MSESIPVDEDLPEFQTNFNRVECCFCPEEVDRESAKTCSTCSRVVCGECTHEIFTETYCPECSVCKLCGNEAVYACDRCSTLCCPNCISERYYTERDTGYQENYLMCSKCIDGTVN